MVDREPYPSEKQDRFIVRLPDGMRDRIKAAAEANNRSMNAEIVAVLEREYPAAAAEIEVAVPDDLLARLDAYRATLPDAPSRPETIRGMIEATLHIVEKDR